MNKPKFVIITSQYYNEGHVFVCEYNDNFLDNAKKFVEKLEDYKRDKENTKDYYYGDLNYFDKDNIKLRYNLNDSGDMYFMMAYSIQDLLEKHKHQTNEIKDYKRSIRGKIPNYIKELCKEHHNIDIVRDIVKSNFKIVD